MQDYTGRETGCSAAAALCNMPSTCDGLAGHNPHLILVVCILHTGLHVLHTGLTIHVELYTVHRCNVQLHTVHWHNVELYTVQSTLVQCTDVHALYLTHKASVNNYLT